MRESQIGWSIEAKLLHEISKKLDTLIKISASITTTSTTTVLP
jgi:hypothetical protein